VAGLQAAKELQSVSDLWQMSMDDAEQTITLTTQGRMVLVHRYKHRA
jgi:hypothetical protein